jgi:hypothetical protein
MKKTKYKCIQEGFLSCLESAVKSVNKFLVSPATKISMLSLLKYRKSSNLYHKYRLHFVLIEIYFLVLGLFRKRQ